MSFARRVPQEAAAACIERLRQQGYAEAAIVGTVLASVRGEDGPTDVARRLIEIG